MTDFLTKELREGLAQARKLAAKKKARLKVHVGDAAYPVLRVWDNGFALDAEDAPHMRGLVDLYEAHATPPNASSSRPRKTQAKCAMNISAALWRTKPHRSILPAKTTHPWP